ncbi:hypothetical protein N7510_008068 [Penicillium lagena]|uniref:uncharacterized protein n=1 Tax=Penicillium lagena TaxID=94218 RepID=UPI0025423E6C|nr:uncharacterized protein N7510_008068 [Penicillium lagena]KAJ5611349.1 hypothetical protein N7510_008068 [Penicillium lagena]
MMRELKNEEINTFQTSSTPTRPGRPKSDTITRSRSSPLPGQPRGDADTAEAARVTHGSSRRESKRFHFRASRTWQSSARVEILWLF